MALDLSISIQFEQQTAVGDRGVCRTESVGPTFVGESRGSLEPVCR